MVHDPADTPADRSFTDRLLHRTFGQPRGLLGRLGGWVMAGGKDATIEWVLEQLSIRPTDRVLEIGFGPGDGIRMAAQATSEGSVAGVDHSTVMVRMARDRNATAVDAGNVDLRHGRASELPFETDSFEAAFSVNSMQLWPDVHAGLDELQRVLVPGGTAAFGFTHHAKQNPNELVDVLMSAGFESIELHERNRAICAVVVTA
ncbi:class I SAM-dependent methyltransferase [Halocatena pleomorpha]|uniref:Methyltransferase domain-containing protein n=1 Tax=Halocatena pleomorpha TaxID=1785090 RepID=A0A3P3RDN9_9EURY|nr:methyltransferase domain-containing protein [Halocatena pleomorpha]RRJ31049.1 methyltransferase domain-containing protein [Halocatena pleomorpha]